MEKKEVPQDKSVLENFTREVYYVKDSDGNYQTELSTGWDVKSQALDNAWEDLDEIIAEAKEEVAKGTKSPIYYFMHLCLMDLKVLSGYTGFRKFSIKRHFKPAVFSKLNDKKLGKYANAFEISLEELKQFKA